MTQTEKRLIEYLIDAPDSYVGYGDGSRGGIEPAVIMATLGITQEQLDKAVSMLKPAGLVNHRGQLIGLYRTPEFTQRLIDPQVVKSSDVAYANEKRLNTRERAMYNQMFGNENDPDL